MKQAEGMRDFTIWPEVNGREPLELLAGQHRIRALEEWVKDAKLGEVRKSCGGHASFTIGVNSISLDQNIKLRANSKDVAKPDSHGDIWLHLVTAVSQKPEKFEGKRQEVLRDMTDTLDLSGTAGGVPMSRLLALRGYDKWRAMIQRGARRRSADRHSTWSLMMACRIDDFCFSTFRQVLETLASLPGDAASYVKPEDWVQMSGFLGHDRSEMETREFFYPGMGSQKVDQSCRRRPNLLVKLDREPYWQVPNAVAESVVSGSILTPRSCSTGDGMQVSTGTDAGGEEKDLPSFVDAPDPGSIFDEAMSKAEENTALSIPSTAGDDSTQQEALDKHRQAQPPFSPQSPVTMLGS
ncbi:hypothetical protein E4U13_001177 [Claviceps humidiphila]|uniref:Uncharacterized protein n=1 Tax=Claviceps humidiphila TaxID=1294629 RepID=A0A9P7Q361_9HYPO|nr:hypothetical protein E4U13_001177 [Claviceps humidiphila]